MDGMKLDCPYDRAAESLGNVVELQHVNVRVPDQLKATAFYISALGLTRDPYLMTGTLFLGAIAVNIANVIGRYIFSAPIFWAEEVLVFIIVWSVFLAAATITYRGEHINMDLFYGKFPVVWKRIVNTVIAAAFLVATGFSPSYALAAGAAMAIALTPIELFLTRGFDNLALPLVSGVLLTGL